MAVNLHASRAHCFVIDGGIGTTISSSGQLSSSHPRFPRRARRSLPTSGSHPSIVVTHKCGPSFSPRRLWTRTSVSGRARGLGLHPQEYGRQRRTFLATPCRVRCDVCRGMPRYEMHGRMGTNSCRALSANMWISGTISSSQTTRLGTH